MTTYEVEHNRFASPGQPPVPFVFPGRDNGPSERLVITFDNGLTLSMIWGRFAYCGPDTVELAVLDEDGFITEDVAKKIFNEDIGDAVDRHCDAERVHAYFVGVQNMREAT